MITDELRHCLEALNLRVSDYETILRIMADCPVYLTGWRVGYYEEAALIWQRVLRLEREQRTKFKQFYIGALKYALAWYEFEGDTMEHFRGKVIQNLSCSTFEAIEHQINLMVMDIRHFQVLLIAAHHFGLDLKLLFPKTRRADYAALISERKTYTANEIIRNDTSFKCKLPERWYFLGKDTTEFIPYQHKNYLNALVNAQQFYVLNRKSMENLVTGLNKNMRSDKCPDYDEENNFHFSYRWEVLRNERRDMEVTLKRYNVIKQVRGVTHQPKAEFMPGLDQKPGWKPPDMSLSRDFPNPTKWVTRPEMQHPSPSGAEVLQKGKQRPEHLRGGMLHLKKENLRRLVGKKPEAPPRFTPQEGPAFTRLPPKSKRDIKVALGDEEARAIAKREREARGQEEGTSL